MIHIVFDTDILSTFAKAGAIRYLEKLFHEDKLLITPVVYSELKVPKEYGYNFPDLIFNSDRFQLVQLTENEADKFKSNLMHLRTLHSGEIEAITIAKRRNYMFSSNDAKALEYAVSQEVEVLHFHTIMRALWRFGVLTKKEVRKLVDVMEQEDNTVIRNKDMIFESVG